MAADYFLKIDGVDGESSDQKHRGEIQIESFSWGQSNSATSVRGGSSTATSKPVLQDLQFVARTGKQSATLMKACASGTHFKSAILTARRAGEQPVDFLKVTLTDVIVSSFQIGGSTGGDDAPMEQIALNFSSVDLAYTPQNPDGSLS